MIPANSEAHHNTEKKDPDEEYKTEQEDFDPDEQTDDLHEIQVDDDLNEPNAEETDLAIEPLPEEKADGNEQEAD